MFNNIYEARSKLTSKIMVGQVETMWLLLIWQNTMCFKMDLLVIENQVAILENKALVLTLFPTLLRSNLLCMVCCFTTIYSDLVLLTIPYDLKFTHRKYCGPGMVA